MSIKGIMALPFDERVAYIVTEGMRVVADQLANEREGVDGHSITAEEARAVLQKLKTARVV
ncbi:MAG: hypothetical protein WA843_02600 [Candidatus Saccharimonadales bacterium]